MSDKAPKDTSAGSRISGLGDVLNDAAPIPKEGQVTDAFSGAPIEPLFEGGMVLRPTHRHDRRIRALTHLQYSAFGVIEQELTTALTAYPVLPATVRETDVLFHAREGVLYRDSIPVDPKLLDPWQYTSLTLDDIMPTRNIHPLGRFIMSFRIFASGRVITGSRLPNSRAKVEVDHYELLRAAGPKERPMRAPDETAHVSLRRLSYLLHHTEMLGRFRPPPGALTPAIDNVDPFWDGEMDDMPMWTCPYLTHPVSAAISYIVLKRHAGQLSDKKLWPHNFFFGSDSYRDEEGAAHGKNDVRVNEARLRLIRLQTVVTEVITLLQPALMYAVAWRPDVVRALAYLRRTYHDRDPTREAALLLTLAQIDFVRAHLLSPVLDVLPEKGFYAASSGFEALLLSPGNLPRPADLGTIGEYGMDDLAQRAIAQPTFAANTSAPNGNNYVSIHLTELLSYVVTLIAGALPSGYKSGGQIPVDTEGSSLIEVFAKLGFGSKAARCMPAEEPVIVGVPLYDDGFRYTRRAIRNVFQGLGDPSIPIVEPALNQHPRGLECEDAFRRARPRDMTGPAASYTYGPDPAPSDMSAPIAAEGFRATLALRSVAIIPREDSVYAEVENRVLPRYFSRGEHLARTRKPDVDIRHDITDILQRAGLKMPPAVVDREVSPYYPGNIGAYWVPNETPATLRTHIRSWLLWNEANRAASVSLDEPARGSLPLGVVAYPGWVPYPAPEQAPPSDSSWGPGRDGEVSELPWDRSLFAQWGVVSRLGLAACAAVGARHLTAVSDLSSFFVMAGTPHSSPYIRWRDREHRAPTLNRPAVRASIPGSFICTTTSKIAARVVVCNRLSTVGWRMSVEGPLPFAGIIGYDIEGPIGVPASDATLTEMLPIAAEILGVPQLRQAVMTTQTATDRVAAEPPKLPAGDTSDKSASG